MAPQDEEPLVGLLPAWGVRTAAVEIGVGRDIMRMVRTTWPQGVEAESSICGQIVVEPSSRRTMFTCTWMSQSGRQLREGHPCLVEVGLEGVLEVRSDHGPDDDAP